MWNFAKKILLPEFYEKNFLEKSYEEMTRKDYISLLNRAGLSLSTSDREYVSNAWLCFDLSTNQNNPLNRTTVSILKMIAKQR